MEELGVDHIGIVAPCNDACVRYIFREEVFRPAAAECLGFGLNLLRPRARAVSGQAVDKNYAMCLFNRLMLITVRADLLGDSFGRIVEDFTAIVTFVSWCCVRI